MAGTAAGLVASNKIEAASCNRCKRIIVTRGDEIEVALIDAVLLQNDFIGSLLPFAAENLDTLVLTRAEPASIGISPIGGYLLPAGFDDEFGVVVKCDLEAKNKINVPISPGLHVDVGISDVKQIAFGKTVNMNGPGIIAFDGDRTFKLEEGESAEVHVERDGPRIIETEAVMARAAQQNLFGNTYNS